MATKGIAALEVKQTYARAWDLCQQVGETPQLFPVLVGLYRSYLTRAELQTAHELGKQCLSLAQRVQDPALLLESHMALTPSFLLLGEIASARGHAEQGIALYNPQQHCSHAFLYQLDPGVVCFSIGAWALWVLGYPDQALKRTHEVLTLAQELSHPLSLAFALWFAALLRQLRREIWLAREQAEAVMTLSTEQGFPQWLAMGTILQGGALAEQGQGEEGIALIRQGLAAHRATGTEVQRTYFLALLAEAYGKVGQAEEGLRVLAEALTQMDNTGERWYEAELYRLRGELLLAQEIKSQKAKGKSQKSERETNPQSLTPNPQGEVEQEAGECFLKAIDIARDQQAKSLELRATMSLARLWQQQGKQTEARQILSEIYHWFTEGFETKDLQEAKMLLDSLESRV
jgi:predicted ATPase